MKKTVVILLAIAIFNSCTTIGSLPTFRQSFKTSSVDGRTDFIELNDGKIIEGKMENINYMGFDNYPRIGKKFTINGANYKFDEIKSIQHKSKYFCKYKNYFVERIIKGRINVFTATQTTAPSEKGRVTSYNLYYLQKGDNSIIESFNNKLMDNYIADNKMAVSKFDDYKKLTSREKNKDGGSYLTDIIETYNK